MGKLVGKEIKKVRNKSKEVLIRVRTLDGNIVNVQDEREVEERGKENFKELLRARRLDKEEEIRVEPHITKKELRNEMVGQGWNREYAVEIKKGIIFWVVFYTCICRNVEKERWQCCGVADGII